MPLWQTVAGYIGLAAVVLSLGSVVSAAADLVTLAVLKRLDPELMKRGGRNFNDRVLLPFSGSVLGALLGSVVPVYFTEGVPPVYIRVIAIATIMVGFVLPFWLWRNDRHALADRWFEIRNESSEAHEVTAFVDEMNQSVAVQRKVDRVARWTRIALLVVTGGFAAMLFWVRSLSPAYAERVPLWVCVLYLLAAVANVVMLIWLDPRVSRVGVNRLQLYEAAALERIAEMEEAAAQEARRLELQRLESQRIHKTTLLGSFGKFLIEVSARN